MIKIDTHSMTILKIKKTQKYPQSNKKTSKFATTKKLPKKFQMFSNKTGLKTKNVMTDDIR